MQSFDLDKLPELPEGYRWVITEKGPLDGPLRMGYLNIYKRTERKFLFWEFNHDVLIEKEVIYDFYFTMYGDGLMEVARKIMDRFNARNLINNARRVMEN